MISALKALLSEKLTEVLKQLRSGEGAVGLSSDDQAVLNSETRRLLKAYETLRLRDAPDGAFERTRPAM